MFDYIKKISFIFSPPYCESCKDFILERTIFCHNCFDKIKPTASRKFDLTSKYSMQVFAISDYQEPIKSLILAKGSSNLLASKYLGQLMWDMTNLKNREFDYLVPVPLHWTRYLKRGFNQAETISQILSEKSDKPVVNILKRTRYTPHQSSLSASERIQNVKNVFQLNVKAKEEFEGKHYVIVDDLLTSGSTLISCAKEIIKLNPASISAIVACKVD